MNLSLPTAQKAIKALTVFFSFSVFLEYKETLLIMINPFNYGFLFYYLFSKYVQTHYFYCIIIIML